MALVIGSDWVVVQPDRIVRAVDLDFEPTGRRPCGPAEVFRVLAAEPLPPAALG